MNDLLGNGTEPEILYQNDELIVFQQENVKWIVTKDNQILMTVKDIGLLGCNSTKSKRYERELRNKEFITPYELNGKMSIYEPFIKLALKGRKDAKMPMLYNYPAITQIIAELRTDVTRERNRQLGLIQEELRTEGFIKLGITPLERLLSKRNKSKDLHKSFTDLFSLAIDYRDYVKDMGGIIPLRINKFYQGITGFTAAELIFHRCNHYKKHCGTETFEGKKGPTKNDVQTAKNYLNEEELDALELFLGTSIQRAKAIKNLTIIDLIKNIDDVAEFITMQYLSGKGKIGSNKAKTYAFNELKKHRKLLPSRKELIRC